MRGVALLGVLISCGLSPADDPKADAKRPAHERRLTGTDATAEQKKKIADILGATFKDMKPLHDRRVENRKAMTDALQAPTIDPAKIEAETEVFK